MVIGARFSLVKHAGAAAQIWRCSRTRHKGNISWLQQAGVLSALIVLGTAVLSERVLDGVPLPASSCRVSSSYWAVILDGDFCDHSAENIRVLAIVIAELELCNIEGKVLAAYLVEGSTTPRLKID